MDMYHKYCVTVDSVSILTVYEENMYFIYEVYEDEAG